MMRGMKNKRFACSLFDSMCDGMRGMPQMHAYIIFKLMSPIQAELVALIYSSRDSVIRFHSKYEENVSCRT